MPFTSSNNITIPNLMYGTAWKKDQTKRLVENALACGFQAIDTANQLKHYDETLVGEALLAAYSKGIKRESLFLQTKFTNKHGQDHRTPYDVKASFKDQVIQSMDSSLQHLHSDYIDSYVLHGPHHAEGISQADWEIWGAIEELYKAGKTRIIGASNINANQLKELCAKANVMPMVVQNRCYAITGWDYNVRKICSENGIIYQGFSLLTANQQVIASTLIQSMCHSYNATAAQIIFAYSLQIGMLPLTGTSSTQHMLEDLESEKFRLSEDELSAIQSCALP